MRESQGEERMRERLNGKPLRVPLRGLHGAQEPPRYYCWLVVVGVGESAEIVSLVG